MRLNMTRSLCVAWLVLCASSLSCGGLVADDSTGPSDTSAQADQSDGGHDECIPIGQRVGLSVANACIAYGLPMTVLPNGYIAWGGDGSEVLWSCDQASYDGCRVIYTDCSTPDGGPVYGTHCVPESMTLTWGSDCGEPAVPPLVACGTSHWSCTEPLPCADAPVDITPN